MTFEIDGVAANQWSGSVPWQESFYGISAGQHTFTWIYSKDTGTPAGSDAAWLDDVLFTPGTTLTVDGTPQNDQFTFDASGPTVVVSLDGESRSFTPGEFTNYLFHGDGGSDTATLTGGAGTNTALLYANGYGQLVNPTAGFTVAVGGMASINANGHAGDLAELIDSPGNDTFYAYADYNGSGRPLAGMSGTGYSNMASGFGLNIGLAINGGSDTALFFDSPGNDTFYAYGGYNNGGRTLAGMYGSYDGYGAYYNAAAGFATNAGYSSGGSDTASLLDAPGTTNTFSAYADYNGSGKPLAVMSGTGYSNTASGFSANIGYASTGSSDTASLFDSPGNDTFYAYADANGGGLPLAGMYGSYGSFGAYYNTASGFSTNVGYSSGGNDTASLFDSPGNDTFYAYADFNQSGRPLAAMYGSYAGYGQYSNMANGFATNVGYSTSGGSDTATFFDAAGNATFFAYADFNGSGRPLAGMNGSYIGFGAYSNLAGGFGANLGSVTSGGNDTADLFGSSGNSSSNALYTDAAIALLYGSDNSGNYAEEASGFQAVNAFAQGGTNTQTKGPDPLAYQLNLLGSWMGGG